LLWKISRFFATWPATARSFSSCIEHWIGLTNIQKNDLIFYSKQYLERLSPTIVYRLRLFPCRVSAPIAGVVFAQLPRLTPTTIGELISLLSFVCRILWLLGALRDD
jgi:hypothetical protein